MDHRKLTVNDLEAMGQNDFLAEELADYVEKNFLLNAPRDLKASIMKQCSTPGVRLASETGAFSRRARLFLYSLKVGAAVAFSILLLALLPPAFPSSFRSGDPSAASGVFFQVPFYEQARKFTDRLNFISYELRNWEVYRYDKQKE